MADPDHLLSGLSHHYLVVWKAMLVCWSRLGQCQQLLNVILAVSIIIFSNVIFTHHMYYTVSYFKDGCCLIYLIFSSCLLLPASYWYIVM